MVYIASAHFSYIIMNTPLLPSIEIETNTPATASVIWLHGLGADGNDFAGIVPQLGLPADAAIRFIFPHASIRPVTVNGGMEMRAWYDIIGIGMDSKRIILVYVILKAGYSI